MIYADTNFYTNLLVEMTHSRKAERLAEETHDVLLVTWLLRLEVLNALQQCVFLSRQGTQQLRLSPEPALMLEGYFLDEIDAGVRFRRCPVDPDAVGSVFRHLSHRHTAKEGVRTYDILHVSTALVLGCCTFWSFDDKARKLAKLEGMLLNELA